MHSRRLAILATVGATVFALALGGPALAVPTADLSNLVKVPNSDADFQGGKLRLTENMADEIGGAWTPLQRIKDGFTATFTFVIGQDGADGIAFVIQNAGTSALGSFGGAIGYGDDPATPGTNEGIPESIAVEFDTWQNGPGELDDPNDNHISIHSVAHAGNSANESAALVPAATNVPFLSDKTNPIDAVVDYHNHVLTVSLEGVQYLEVLNLNIGQYMTFSQSGNSQGGAYVGFTGATGNLGETQMITAFTLT